PHTVALGLNGTMAIDAMEKVTDFRERAWIETSGNPQARANGPCRVTIRRAPYGYELDATMQGDGWIVVTNCDWKGWRASIDGRRVRTQRANASFIGIHAPQGQHRIRLEYWPQSFVRGRAISFSTLIAIAAFIAI